jgi:predicted RNA-binding protein YlxR (DUF448 family)
MKQRKAPERMCVSCRTMRPKKDLIRVVRAPEGGVAVDPVGKKPGRGAYICAARACVEQAQKRKKLERALEDAGCAEVYPQLLRMADARETEAMAANASPV